MGWIALAILTVGSLELFLLLKVAGLIGYWYTVTLVLGTALLGGYLMKREGLRVWREWSRALAEMRLPEEGITSGLLVLVGGVLLLTPGVISDVTGIALMIPPIRKVIAQLIERRVRARMESGGGPASVFDFRVVTPQGAYGRRRVVDVHGVVVEDREVRVERPQRRGPASGDVIEGEVVDADTRRLGRGE